MLQQPATAEDSPLQLLVPSLVHLDAYADALRRSWSPDNIQPEKTALEELEHIDADPAAFVTLLDDREAKAGPITLPDGTQVPRLPGYRRWIWDNGFCGSINLRWQPGTEALPPHCLGHIGYAVVPWKRGRGYATRALAMLLPEARREGLAYVELTADLANVPSQKVITNNGGVFVKRFDKGPAYGNVESLLFRIFLSSPLPR
jgi:predicted acetyltransferase